jgi:hypothetical protein
MWIYTIVNVATGEIVYYVISGAERMLTSEGRGVSERRSLVDVMGGKVIVDVGSFDCDLVMAVGKPLKGDLLAAGFFERS